MEYHIHICGCHCSLAAVTPGKYEYNFKDLIYTFASTQFSPTEKLMNGALVATPLVEYLNLV